MDWNGNGWRHKRSRLAASILTTSLPRWHVPRWLPSSICLRKRPRSLWCHFLLWRSSMRMKGKMSQLPMDITKNKYGLSLVQAVTYCLIFTNPLHLTMRTVYYDRDCALFLLEPRTICNPKLPMNAQKCIKQNLYKATTVLHSPLTLIR